MFVAPVEDAVKRTEQRYQPFARAWIEGAEPIPVGVPAVQAARSNEHAPACVNEVIETVLISAALKQIDTRYLLPASNAIERKK